MSFLKNLHKKLGNPNGSIVADGIVGDLSGFIDTGSLLLNAEVSGSMFKGLPDNKISMFCGPQGVGKSFILLTIIAQFLSKYPKANVIFFESESAQRTELMEKFGVDTSRVYFAPITTVQELRTQALQTLEEYEKTFSAKERVENKLFLCLDSLGNLSTSKETEDSMSGKETQDMTRAKLIKSTFRVLTLKLGILGVPFICTNHIYMSQSLFPTAIAGGGCLLAGSRIIMSDLSTKQIQNVEVGDLVLTETGSSKVVRIWNSSNLQEAELSNPECYRIHFSDGYFIECSANHKFRHSGIWIKASRLYSMNKKQDYCYPFTLDSVELLTREDFYDEKEYKKFNRKEIINIEPIGQYEVYDIEVENDHHYILNNGVISKNSGALYNASLICFLSKRKEKDGTAFVGNVIHCNLDKSRFTKEGSKIDIYINFSKGLDRYYGLLDYGVKYGMIQSIGNKFQFPGMETKAFRKEIMNHPETYFTDDFLKLLDTALAKEFLYGSVFDNQLEEDVNEVDIEE